MDEPHSAVVLIIDDSRSAREEIKALLAEAQPGLLCFEADNGLDGFKVLLEQSVDLVLCDLVMPQMDGLQFLQLRASRPDLMDIPVIMLTAIEDVEKKITVLSAGAGDYITKPFHPGEFAARAMAHLRIKLLQDELRRKNELLIELSTTDGLTRVYNRRHFLDLSRQEFDRCDRLDLVASLMILDIDHFKHINDGLGHHAGDDVLVALCRHVERALRDYDVFGRHGGDEFTLLLPQTNLAQALSIGQRLVESASALDVPILQGMSLSFSGGIATRQSAGETLDAVLRRADQALYQAKRQGRGRVVAL